VGLYRFVVEYILKGESMMVYTGKKIRLGENPRAKGTNPKATNTNPRARGSNPRAIRYKSKS
jgi:hypothetical protein